VLHRASKQCHKQCQNLLLPCPGAQGRELLLQDLLVLLHTILHHWNQVELDFSRPGTPMDNWLIEAFNGSVRRECLSQHWFASIAEAQQILDAWRTDYNSVRSIGA